MHAGLVVTVRVATRPGGSPTDTRSVTVGSSDTWAMHMLSLMLVFLCERLKTYGVRVLQIRTMNENCVDIYEGPGTQDAAD